MKMALRYFNLLCFTILSHALSVNALDFPSTYPASSQIRFIENKGQQPAGVLYNGKVSGGNIYLEKNAFTYYLFSGEDLQRIHPLREDSVVIRAHAWKETFVNANTSAVTYGNSPSAYKLNYFIGNDPSHWATDVQDYAMITYKDLYQGVDMNVYSFGPNFKYDLIVQPGADVAMISIKFEGVEKISLIEEALVVTTSIGNFTEQKPYAYQIETGIQKQVKCKFVLENETVSFKVIGKYNKNLPLIIDPTLIFASYTGSTADNFGYTATYDATGSMLLGGLVHSEGYPVTLGAVQFNYGGGSNIIGNGYACDMGIMKLSPMGNALVWATYVGGSSNETPHSMVVDQNNNVCIYGRTWSDNYPTTANAYDKTYNQKSDIVITKISSNGNVLMGSTYLGGTDDDGVNINATEPGTGSIKVNYGDDARGEIITDDAGNIYVATCTSSPDFPTSASAFQKTIGGNQDGCIFKFNPDVSSLIWSSFLGGSGDDACYSLDIYNNELFTSGGTASTNFPATASSLHSTYQGGSTDGFVSHISADGSTLLQSSFIGTAAADQSYFVKLDKSSNVYLYGQTSGAFPVSANVYSNPGSGQFIQKLNPTLSTSIYSTVFGNSSGKPNISPTAFLVDTCENLYISGWGGSVYTQWSWFDKDMHNMPITNDALQSTTDGNDFYIAVFKKNMASLAYATYYGGNTAPNVATEHVDGGTSRFDKNGVIYQAMCAGCGGTSTTPSTPGAWSETNNSFNCNELGLKLEVNLFVVSAALNAFPTITGCEPLTVQFTNNSTNATVFQWYFGDGGSSTLENPIHTFTDTGTFQIMLIASDPTACVPKDTAYTTVVVYDTQVDGNFLYQIIDLCDSIQINLQGNSSSSTTTYTWDFGDGGFAAGQSVSHMYTIPGLYTVTIYANDPEACNPLDTSTIVVDFTNVVQAELSKYEYFGCPPLTVNFSNIGYGGTSFFWDFGDGNTSSEANPTHVYPNPGTYYGIFIAGDPSACKPFDTALFKVTVFDYPPVAAFSINPTSVVGYSTPIQFTNQSVGASYYYWEFGDGDTSTDVNPVHTYQLSGDYLACLTAYNDGSCPAKVCKLIHVDLIPVVDVPNAFSPNGDGANDILYVKGQDVKSLSFKVFNRWGEKVFETNDIHIGWNGMYKGVAQEMEVYVWELNAIFSTGQASVRSGNVTLLR